MKKTTKRKLWLTSITGLTLLTTTMIASACSATAKPGVPYNFVNLKSTTNNNYFGHVAVKVNIDNNRKTTHEFVFGNQNQILNNAYYAIGDLNYTYNKDNKRYDAKNEEINADGFLLKNDVSNTLAKQEVWTASNYDKPGYLKPFNTEMIRNELVRLVYNKLTYPTREEKNITDPNALLPTNLETATGFNVELFKKDQAKINELASLYNHLLVTDSVYTYISSFTDQLLQYINLDMGTKIFGFYNNTDNEVAKEFLVALATGVGEGRYTYKLALYNMDFDYEIYPVNQGSDLSHVDAFGFGTKVSDDLLINPEKNNVLIKIKNLKLQYAWYDSSGKTGGNFILPVNDEALKQGLENINFRLSEANKKTYPKKEISNLVYNIPLADIVLNFRPSVLTSNKLNDQATQQKIMQWKAMLKRDLTEEEIKAANVYNQYYAGSLVKVDAFNVTGFELKKALTANNTKTTADDDKFNDLAYYPHDRGQDAVYPYAIDFNNATLQRDNFVQSALFNEYIKKAVASKTIYGNNGVIQYAKVAGYSLIDKDIKPEMVFDEQMINLIRSKIALLLDLNNITPVDKEFDYANEWNLEKHLLSKN
ncbi:hypothetical protein OF377_02475 [Ureaplasma sp. ES3154-GEN]|uniref:hypothetical protein n=1 Tax=Ureaplasma sp. ES3154-GEN TaxID=2984844 RepID=UPI0021E93C6C|nr:hypothetical protein [Ureaplasma sp. ES3154-GEN]MCV3743729.1 hypothetical protein [Ureaplasma sp. ES3154-GEN]